MQPFETGFSKNYDINYIIAQISMVTNIDYKRSDCVLEVVLLLTVYLEVCLNFFSNVKNIES